jgi:hypothetical protein
MNNNRRVENNENYAHELRNIGESLLQMAEHSDFPLKRHVKELRNTIMNGVTLYQYIKEENICQNNKKSKNDKQRLMNFDAGSDLRKLPEKVDGKLLNVFDHGKNEQSINRGKEMCNRSKPIKIILDSSGFALLNSEIKNKFITHDENAPLKRTKKLLNIAPKHVMEIAKIHNPDIVIGLDFPI